MVKLWIRLALFVLQMPFIFVIALMTGMQIWEFFGERLDQIEHDARMLERKSKQEERA